MNRRMPAKMTLGEMAKALNRPAVYLTGLQRRFELPVLEGAAYSYAYFGFLRTLVHLRILGIAEELLLELWKTEKHLLQLLHFDTTGSPTWYLDQCGQGNHTDRRLLLSKHDMGPEYEHRMLQPHLDFSVAPRGLFSSKEVGDDVLLVLGRYRDLCADLCAAAAEEAPQLRATLHWVPRLRILRPEPES